MSAWKPSVFGRPTLSRRSDHVLPAVHPAPADFALRGEPLAMLLGDVAGFAEGLGDGFLALGGIGGPVVHAGRGIDPDHAGLANSDVAELPCDAAGLFDHGQKLLALRRRSHGRAAADRRPHRRDHGADRKPVTGDLVREVLDVVLARINRCVRVGEEEVDALEPGAVRASSRSQPQHRVKIDRGLRIRPLANEPRPHRVVEPRVIVAGHAFPPVCRSGSRPECVGLAALPAGLGRCEIH